MRPGKDERWYDIPGVGRLPSVTTILQVIAKPALYNWHAKHGSAKALRVMELVGALDPSIYNAVKEKLPPDFFRNGTAIAEEAADFGKLAHAIIEQDLRGNPLSEPEFLALPGPVQNAITSYRGWRDRTEFTPIKTESRVHSVKLRYAGTLDALGKTVKGIVLGDWKTSGGIYPEHHLQAVAYKYAAEEMTGERIPNITIFRFGKDGSFEDYDVPQSTHADLFDRFIDAKRLWDWKRAAA